MFLTKCAICKNAHKKKLIYSTFRQRMTNCSISIHCAATEKLYLLYPFHSLSEIAFIRQKKKKINSLIVKQCTGFVNAFVKSLQISQHRHLKAFHVPACSDICWSLSLKTLLIHDNSCV